MTNPFGSKAEAIDAINASDASFETRIIMRALIDGDPLSESRQQDAKLALKYLYKEHNRAKFVRESKIYMEIMWAGRAIIFLSLLFFSQTGTYQPSNSLLSLAGYAVFAWISPPLIEYGLRSLWIRWKYGA